MIGAWACGNPKKSENHENAWNNTLVADEFMTPKDFFFTSLRIAVVATKLHAQCATSAAAVNARLLRRRRR